MCWSSFAGAANHDLADFTKKRSRVRGKLGGEEIEEEEEKKRKETKE